LANNFRAFILSRHRDHYDTTSVLFRSEDNRNIVMRPMRPKRNWTDSGNSNGPLSVVGV